MQLSELQLVECLRILPRVRPFEVSRTMFTSDYAGANPGHVTKLGRMDLQLLNEPHIERTVSAPPGPKVSDSHHVSRYPHAIPPGTSVPSWSYQIVVCSCSARIQDTVNGHFGID